MDKARGTRAIRSMLSMFRMRSILFRILIVLCALVVGIVSIFYAFFRRTFETRYREQAVSSYLALLDYAGSQVNRELFQIGARAEDVLQTPEVNGEIISGSVLHNPDSIRIALFLSRLAGEGPLAAKAVLCYTADYSFIASDNTVTHASASDPFREVFRSYCEKLGSGTGGQGLYSFNGELYLVRSLPRTDPLAVVAVQIDLSELYSLLEEQLKAGELLGEKKTLPVFAYFGQDELFSAWVDYPSRSELLVINREARGQNDEVCTLAGTDGFLLAHTMPESNICLVGILRGTDVTIRGGQLLSAMLPAMLLAVVLILLSGALMIKFAYRPIGGLASDMMMQRSGENRLQSPPEAQDEFDLIRSLYQEQKDREQEMTEILQRAGSAVTDRILWDAIQEKESGEENARSLLAQTRSAFRPNMKYQVILIETENDRGDQRDTAEEMLHRMMVQQLCRNYWKDKTTFSLPETGEEPVALILGYDKEKDENSLREEIRAFLRHLAQQTRGYQFHPVVGIGTVGEGVETLAGVYREARSNLQKNLYYDRPADEEEDTEVTEERMSLYPILERLTQEEDPGVIRSEIRSRVRDTEPECRREQFLSYVDSAVELLSRFHLPCEEQCTALRLSIQESDESGAERYANQVEALLIDSVDKCVAAKNREKMHYLESAMHYIEEHYSDSMLSLASVGEKCGISGGYLSRLFAQYYHENFTDYLNRFRVERAGLLLSQTSMTIAEVGLRTGFNSPQNFSRVFKKYKNTTPSQYRMDERK